MATFPEQLRSSLDAHASQRPAGLVAYTEAYAPQLLQWVQSDDELFQLAPRTLPPLTEAKIAAWQVDGGLRFLHWHRDEPAPNGYVELNPMPHGKDQWWLGHCLVSPLCRGQSVGQRMVRLVLEHAFELRDAKQIALVVFPSNAAAVRCYEQVGFVQHGDVMRRFATRPGRHRMLYMSIERRGYEKHRASHAAQDLPPRQ
jgi:RimJ/RimL family protein N-acetyltransferase